MMFSVNNILNVLGTYCHFSIADQSKSEGAKQVCDTLPAMYLLHTYSYK